MIVQERGKRLWEARAAVKRGSDLHDEGMYRLVVRGGARSDVQLFLFNWSVYYHHLGPAIPVSPWHIPIYDTPPALLFTLLLLSQSFWPS